MGEADIVRCLETGITPRRGQAAHGPSRRILLLAVGEAEAVAVFPLGQNDGARTGCRGQPTSLMVTCVVHTVSLLCHPGGNHLGPTYVPPFLYSVALQLTL